MTSGRWRKKYPMPKGKMTIEKLAGFMKDSFSTFEERFDGVEQRFQTIEDRMEQRFNRIDAELAAIRRQQSQAVYQPELVALDRRVTRLEKKVGIEPK
jgi:polyhydroxyalkanoate synthesis regulator phasin